MYIQTLLLAAGGGTRFGGDKLCAPLPDGTPMVLASAQALLHAGCDVLAVVRQVDVGAGLLLQNLPGVRLLCCPEAVGGLGFSLATGVRHSAAADAWLVALADMPLIRPATHAKVLSALARGSFLVAPMFAGRRGHPVGFAQCWRAQLLELSGDHGARALLTEHAAMLDRIQTDDPGILLDIDRRDDLHRLPVLVSATGLRDTVDMHDELETLSADIGRCLVDAGLILTTAESCTGGWIAKCVTDVAGSSAWFDRGLVVYSNAAKRELLGVAAETLDLHGAVSEAVVREMALGALRNGNAQVSVAVSGIAGPGGGSTDKPVGTLCFGFALPGQLVTETMHFDGHRDAVRQQSVAHALRRLIGLLSDVC